MSENPIENLTLREKASLTAGRDIWHLPGIERVGVAPLKMSDGPSGVRGERYNTRRSLSFPCGMAAGATWDVSLLGRYGEALAAEARSKGVHLLLGPTICIPRTPVAGRTFESLSEDPHLTSRLTVAYVAGVQSGGVGACVKHFACNDQEHERMTISAEVDDVTLREVHLPAFEAAVRQAGVWAVMSAYNKLNGTHCGEHPDLLGTILKDEWGFDGVVVSDWFGTHSTVEATEAGLDIEMPGTGFYLGPKLAAAVEAGEVDESVVDEHAARILRLVDRVGARGDGAPVAEAEEDDPDRRALARELCVGGSVLLANRGVLPLDASRLGRVAMIGPAADRLETGGGGSSSVTPLVDASPVDELRRRLDGVEVVHEVGCRLDLGNSLINPRLLDGGGLRIDYFSEPDGDIVETETAYQPRYASFGDPMPGLAVETITMRASGTFVPDHSGEWTMGLSNTGDGRLRLDGDVVVDNTGLPRGTAFYGLGADARFATVALEAGRSYEIVVDIQGTGAPGVGFEIYANAPASAGLVDAAVAAARDADVAVVVVGANPQLESEGHDRTDLALMGEQDELVRAVAAVNDNTVVVVNAGSPVEMPWIDDVAAVLLLWYPGEEGAAALADMVLGISEPGGRLPITFPASLDDVPTSTPESYPGVDGRVVYSEGLLLGYRHYDANDVEPLFAFGHGLGYTTFERGEVELSGDVDAGFQVTVSVTNTGTRSGSDVVQVYVGAAEPGLGRPVRQLAGFATVTLDPGQSRTVTVDIDERSYHRWDADSGDWTLVPGTHHVSVGTSSREFYGRASLET